MQAWVDTSFTNRKTGKNRKTVLKTVLRFLMVSTSKTAVFAGFYRILAGRN